MIDTLVSFILSLFGGGVAGAVVTWWLRTRGKVICEIDPSWTGGTKGSNQEMRNFQIKFQNMRDVGVGIWNMRVVLTKKGQQPLEAPPTEAGTNSAVGVLHLPPRVPISRHLSITIGGNYLQTAREADKTEVVMTVVGEGERREDLPHWTAF